MFEDVARLLAENALLSALSVLAAAIFIIALIIIMRRRPRAAAGEQEDKPPFVAPPKEEHGPLQEAVQETRVSVDRERKAFRTLKDLELMEG
jgi:hypothetical protein